jgi:glycine C-acetyltransferase/8-amino-7-oxononanoate synthase
MSEGLDRWLAETLAARGRAGWSTAPVVISSASPGRAWIEGRERLLLCTNDYLGLAADPRVVDASRAALERYGAGSRAARSLAGDTELHRELEHELAAFKGTEAALLFGSGFATNVGVVSALAGKGDVIFSDELNHASIVDGCRLSAAAVRVYRHRDAGDLDRLLAAEDSAAKRMVVTDAVFSMDGTVAPVPALLEAAGRHDAFLMLDEAHATGVLGERGEGSLEHFGLQGRVPVVMGTLGKALGSVGGFIAGSRDLVDVLAASARSFLFTTSLPPAAVAAALESLRILRAEPTRVARLWANARRLHAGFAELGFDVAAEAAPIVPVFLDDDAAAGVLARRLYELRVVVSPLGPPYVPAGTSRLRVIASAAQTDDDLGVVLEAFAQASGRAPVLP